jgi:uncharacterized membrane protein
LEEDPVNLTGRIVAVILLFCAPLALAQLQLTVTILDAPGGDGTQLTGINNNGVISGYYLQNNETGGEFTWQNGVFSYFNVPDECDVVTGGINDSNQVVGYYAPQVDCNQAIGLVYDGATFTYFQYPGAQFTRAYGINNAGLIVGTEFSMSSSQLGILYDGTTFRTITKGSDSIAALGVNNLGAVVGVVTENTVNYGFLRSGGKLTRIAYPGAITTTAYAINDNGTILGGEGINTSCFVYKNGQFKTFSISPAMDTICTGINNAGVIVGYTIPWGPGPSHGFYTSPVTDADFN